MEDSCAIDKLEKHMEFFVSTAIRIQLLISELVSNDFLTFEEADEVVWGLLKFLLHRLQYI